MMNLKYKITTRRVTIVIVALAFLGLIAYNVNNPTPNAQIGNGKPWNSGMSLGDAKAPNKLIIYTDFFCSYCANIHAAINNSQFNKNYIKTGKVRLENRVTTMLSGVSDNTDQGAEAAYCSADQNKYWEYSNDITARIKSDYFDKGIGVKDVANPQKIPELALDYFMLSAKNTGLDLDKFKDCVSNKKHAKEIETNTNKAISLGVNGLPYIVVNNYQSSGFVGDYDTLVTVLKAGGVN